MAKKPTVKTKANRETKDQRRTKIRTEIEKKLKKRDVPKDSLVFLVLVPDGELLEGVLADLAMDHGGLRKALLYAMRHPEGKEFPSPSDNNDRIH